MGHHGPRAHHRAVAQGDAAHEHRVVPQPHVVSGDHPVVLPPPVDQSRVIRPQPVVGAAVGKVVGRRPDFGRVLHRVDAHAGGDGVELAQGGIDDVVGAEAVGVVPHLGLLQHTVVADLHIAAEPAVFRLGGGVDQRPVGAKLFRKIQHYRLLQSTTSLFFTKYSAPE